MRVPSVCSQPLMRCTSLTPATTGRTGGSWFLSWVVAVGAPARGTTGPDAIDGGAAGHPRADEPIAKATTEAVAENVRPIKRMCRSSVPQRPEG